MTLFEWVVVIELGVVILALVILVGGLGELGRLQDNVRKIQDDIDSIKSEIQDVTEYTRRRLSQIHKEEAGDPLTRYQP